MAASSRPCSATCSDSIRARYVAFEIAPASLTVVRLFEGKGVLSEMIRAEPPETK